MPVLPNNKMSDLPFNLNESVLQSAPLQTEFFLNTARIASNKTFLQKDMSFLANNVSFLPKMLPRTGAGPPSSAAYYVALTGVLILLLFLLMYCLYFILSKIIELSKCDSLTDPIIHSKPSSCSRQQSVVRESAGAMAKLCKQQSATDDEQVTETISTTTTLSTQIHSSTHSR